MTFNDLLSHNQDEDTNSIVETFELLSNNEDFIIRMSLSSNINCPDHILWKLSCDENPFVKLNILFNNNCKKDIVENVFLNLDETFIKTFIYDIVRDKRCSSYALKKFYKKYLNMNYIGLIDIILSHPNFKLKDFE